MSTESRQPPAPSPGAPPPGHATGTPVSGWAWVFFAYDVGFSIDLSRVAPLVGEGAQRRLAHAARRAPAWLQYEPAPIRLRQSAPPVVVGAASTHPEVELTLYDFGGVSVGYRVRVDGRIDDLPALSAALADNHDLAADSRKRVQALVDSIPGCITRPGIAGLAEDYTVFCLEDWGPDPDPARFIERHAHALARTLQAETGGLSPGQVAESLAARIGFGPTDTALIEWQCAVVMDKDPADTLAVLEHTNIELLEMRYLDQLLDAILEESYSALALMTRFRFWHPWIGRRTQQRLAMLRADSAVMFEGVNNAIKLMGDQFLARLYRTASNKFHLPEWDASVLRKLQTTQEIYQMISDTRATLRMEVLEIIIILLIAVSIVLPFLGLPGY